MKSKYSDSYSFDDTFYKSHRLALIFFNMGTRRTFIKKISALSIGTQLARNCNGIALIPKPSWDDVAKQFFVSDKLNFNTGSAGMMPIPVYEDFIENTKKLCSAAPYEVQSQHQEQINNSMLRLGSLIDSPLSNLSFVRNSTEGLDALLWSLPFKKDEEIIYSIEGYPYVENTLNLLQKTKGVRPISIITEPEYSNKEILEKYQKAITAKTRLIVVSHITHRDGHIMPVKEICALAHSQGVEVLLDSAHAIGQVNHSVTEIDCDYYVTSMHKWLYAPLGSALLFVKEEHLGKLFPSYAYPAKKQNEIAKFDYTGTIAFQNKMTLRSVLDFNDYIGLERKTERLKELSLYLANGLANIKDVKLKTDLSKSVGIVTFAPPVARYFSRMVTALSDNSDIHIKKVSHHRFGFLRASLNLHLMEKDIDKLLNALELYLKNK